MIKVLITDKLAQEGIDLINSADGVQAVVKTGLNEDELSDIIGQYDGLIIRSGTKVTAKVLAKHGKLKAIARAGVGVDNIDIPEATRRGVIVMNTPGGNTLSAAEHTMALILSIQVLLNRLRLTSGESMNLTEYRRTRVIYGASLLLVKVVVYERITTLE